MALKTYKSGNAEIRKAGLFAKAVKGMAKQEGVALDSATCTAFIETNGVDGGVIPTFFAEALDSCSADDQARIMAAMHKSISVYEENHNCEIPPDVMNQALHNAKCALDSASATGEAASPTGLQAAQAIVSINATLAAAVPFAHYATSNNTEVPIALLTRYATNKSGMYDSGDSIDGINSGKSYMGSQRAHTLTTGEVADGDTKSTVTGKLTAVQTSLDVCDQDADDVEFQAGRGVLMYLGRPVAFEHAMSGAASTIAGNVTISGTAYTISGNFNPKTGAISIDVTPAIADLDLVFESLLKYEGNDALIPGVGVDVKVESLFASDWKGFTDISREAMEMMTRELGLNGTSEALIGIQTQFVNERHYLLLQKAMRLASGNTMPFDLQYEDRKANMSISDMWRDLSAVISAASQKMAEDTNSHGVGFAYVTGAMAKFMRSLPAELFTPSGLSERPGIYRMGTLVGGVEVYYTPRILTGTATTAQMLLIGRGADVARSAFVMGDVVPPLMRAYDSGKSINERHAFYGKTITDINPHASTWGSAALIEVTGLPVLG